MNSYSELYVSLELGLDSESYLRSIIDIFRWMPELGRIDIIIKVSLLSSHLAFPREGHLDATVHIMAYVRQKNNSRLVYDPTYPDIDHNILKKCD